MKSLKILMVCFAFIAMGSIITSCGGSSEKKAATEEVDMSGPEYTSAYICPMHCEGSGSAEPGKCPVCGMDYVMNENMEGSDHDDHEGHNH